MLRFVVFPRAARVAAAAATAATARGDFVSRLHSSFHVVCYVRVVAAAAASVGGGDGANDANRRENSCQFAPPLFHDRIDRGGWPAAAVAAVDAAAAAVAAVAVERAAPPRPSAFSRSLDGVL